jgi:hypothetical protein
MSATRYQDGDLRAIGVICAVAAALLASACDGSSDPLVLQATVQSAPNGSTCSTANGVATAATADVSNVVVTCSDKFYTLGGTIRGLTGAGLVLANGDNTVSVPANSTSFTLPTPLPYTNRYAVTVAAQPAGLTCSVSNGSGAMPASDVTSIKVKCLDNANTVGGITKDLNATRLVLLLALARSARLPSF